MNEMKDTETMNRAKQKKGAATAQRRIIHIYEETCSSGNVVQLWVESWGPGQFGEWKIKWRSVTPLGPRDADEGAAFKRKVVELLSAEAGRELELTTY